MKRLAIGLAALAVLAAAPVAAQELPFHLEPVESPYPLYRPGWEQHPYQIGGGCHLVRVQQRRVLRDGRVTYRTVRRCV